MLFDDLLIEANREDVHRSLRKIYANRRDVAIALGGRPPVAKTHWLKMNWLTSLFSSRNQAQVEYLEPLAVRVRND